MDRLVQQLALVQEMWLDFFRPGKALFHQWLSLYF